MNRKSIEELQVGIYLLTCEKKIFKSLKKKLFELGFVFNNDKDLIDFAEYRISKIDSCAKPNCFCFYLDFKSDNDKGVLILSVKKIIKIL